MRWAAVAALLVLGIVAKDHLWPPSSTPQAAAPGSSASSPPAAGTGTVADPQPIKNPLTHDDPPAQPPPVAPPPDVPHVVKVSLPDKPNLPDPPESEPALNPEPPPVVKVPSNPEPAEPDFSSLDDAAYRDYDAGQLLREFLIAETLVERWPMMFTESNPKRLLGGILDRPLPAIKEMELEYQDARPEEGYVDHVHAVTFADESSSSVERVVVRQWQDGRPPKVLADPLLDLYGGRLQAFLSQPGNGEGEFDVIISVLASCSDPSLSHPENKMTVKLMGRDHGAEIGRAHVIRGGSISKLLADGSFRLSYGNPTACRVRLRWNALERPDQPWLEAVEISRFGWGGAK